MSKKAKMNNKGFSLVELIIVVAIMAILAGVMIPQFVKYLENSKKSADLSQAEAIANAVAAQYAEDMANGTTSLTYSATPTTVDGTVASTLNMGSNAPTSKLQSGAGFEYSLDTSNGEVQVYIGGISVYPDPTGTSWD
ncbi:MAG: type IV pilin protein [Roseburia sp.]